MEKICVYGKVMKASLLSVFAGLINIRESILC